MECFICKAEGIERYSDSKCSSCGQEYEYLWDGVAIVLSEQQIQLLKSEGKNYPNLREEK